MNVNAIEGPMFAKKDEASDQLELDQLRDVNTNNGVRLTSHRKLESPEVEDPKGGSLSPRKQPQKTQHNHDVSFAFMDDDDRGVGGEGMDAEASGDEENAALAPQNSAQLLLKQEFTGSTPDVPRSEVTRSGHGPPCNTMFGVTASTFRQMFAACSACLIMVGCGTSFGWVSPTLVKLNDEDNAINMTTSESSWMVSIIEVGNLVSPVPAGLLADRFGRKPLILSTGPLYIISWLIILRIKTFAALIVCRVVQGLAIGIAFTVVPMYLGEIASQKIRGAITSLFQTAFYFGFLYEYVIGPFVSFDVLVLVSLAVPISFMALFVLQPESPHYYVMRGNPVKAERSLMWLRGTTNKEDVRDELDEMTQTVLQEMANKNKRNWKDIVATPSDRRALLITQVVGAVRMMSGQAPIISYSTTLFQKTGFTLIQDYVMTMIMGSVLFVSGFFSTALTDSIGRRPLLLISSVGCTVTLGIVSVYFFCFTNTSMDMSQYSWVCPTCIILYNLFLAFGLDPVSMTYRSELFPANTRAVAAIVNSMNITVGGFITLQLFQTITDVFGVYLNFVIFALSCFFGTIWMFFCAIETKNKNLGEIQKELSKTSGCC